jgi:3-oxoacyl-[acyl-carrier protein] reductase
LNTFTTYEMSGLGFAEGEVAVVTGAGSGIGRACALMAARSGLTVVLWDRDAAGLEGTLQELSRLGLRAHGRDVDVTNPQAVAAGWGDTRTRGPCRYLINNAGPPASSPGAFDKLLTDAVGSMQNVTSTWLELCGADARSVVNMSSIAGNLQGVEDANPFYPAAKAAIAGYTRHLATRYRGMPRANAIAPGIIETPRTRPYMDRPVIQQMVARIPQGRLGTASEIASVACFLLSPAAGYVNGALVAVDGGLSHAS